jgi:FKBP-type peptidyl-prolyl cis-trans isomerase
MRERLFAGFGAALFLITASGLTIFVIFAGSNNDDTPPQTQTCTENASETPLPAPQIYKPTEPVTSLQKDDLTVGDGATAKAGDCLVVKYYGTLAKDGTKFDENYTSNLGFAFTLGSGQVIPGWDQGLVGMKVGGTRRLVIPAALGYGNQASGSIPANSDLVFVVKLLRIQS